MLQLRAHFESSDGSRDTWGVRVRYSDHGIFSLFFPRFGGEVAMPKRGSFSVPGSGLSLHRSCKIKSKGSVRNIKYDIVAISAIGS